MADAGGPPTLMDSSVGPCLPMMTNVLGLFCIDNYEVSVAAYDEFLAFVRASRFTNRDPRCAWNVDYNPEPSQVLPGGSSKAVVGIDFCDALAFCENNAKRLCGARRDVDSGAEEWATACSANGTRKYPYGNEFVKGRCVVEADGGALGSTRSVGTPSDCEGGYPGLYEMVGNVHEWNDLLEKPSEAGPRNDDVKFKGAAFGQSLRSGCDTVFSLPRHATANDIGFRCCADVRH